jgi:hypothetical protein
MIFNIEYKIYRCEYKTDNVRGGKETVKFAAKSIQDAMRYATQYALGKMQLINITLWDDDFVWVEDEE